jgi:hypothetical protein
MAPIIAMGIVLAAPAVSVMYRPAYWEVGTLTAYLTIGTWLGAMSTFYTVVLMAAGTPKYMTLGSIAKIILFSALVFFVTPRFGVEGVAVMVSLTELGYLVVAMLGCRQIGVVAWKSDLAITAFGRGLPGGVQASLRPRPALVQRHTYRGHRRRRRRRDRRADLRWRAHH